MTAARLLLMIGLDAADPVLVDQWIGEGRLPNLASLRARGTEMRLETAARYLAGSPWPSFFTSQHPTGHGLYADFQWRQERMEFAAPAPDWFEPKPFWRELETKTDIVIYDVPFVSNARPVPGVEIAGWATHDKLFPATSYPDNLLSEVREQFGAWPMPYEAYGPAPVQDLLTMRDKMLENTRRSAELILHLLQRPWRLALVCFSALHHGGHRLFDRSSVRGAVSDEAGLAFDRSLRDLYEAADQAVGRIAAAHPEADLVVFSLHGMMVNTSRADILEGMLTRVLAGDAGAERRKSVVRVLGEALPYPLRRAITRRIPRTFQNRLMTAWTSGGVDWSRTEAFCCRADLQGYIRLNLKGREAQGAVEPHAVDALVERIRDGLMSFRDADTGEAFIEDVLRVEDVMPDGPARDLVPDLLVMWRESPAASLHTAASPRFGTVARGLPGQGQGPNGRSGNHRPEGILFAVGQGIPAGHRATTRPHTIDLAPTILHRLGLRCRMKLAGQLIPELAGTA